VDKGVRARVDGRNKVAQQTVWSMDVQGVRTRCLRHDDATYEVQFLIQARWTKRVATGADPWELLKQVAGSQSFKRLLTTPEQRKAVFDRLVAAHLLGQQVTRVQETKYLFARVGARGHFAVVAGDGLGTLDRLAYRDLVVEAAVAGIQEPLLVYARSSSYSGPGVELLQPEAGP
jgi:hypothetical protein